MLYTNFCGLTFVKQPFNGGWKGVDYEEMMHIYADEPKLM